MDVVQKFRALFAFDEERTVRGYHPQVDTSRPDGKLKFGSIVTGSAPEDKEWDEHVAGVGAWLGGPPMMSNGVCHRAVIDVDIKHAKDRGEAAWRKIQDRIDATKCPAVATLSKSGGVHIHIRFLSEETRATVHRGIVALAQALGVSRMFECQIEFMPDAKSGRKPVQLPYYGEMAQRPDTNIEDFLQAVEDHATSLSDLEAWVRKQGAFLQREEPKRVSSDKPPKTLEDFLLEAPPCYAKLMGGPAEQGRNNILHHLRARMEPASEDWADWMMQANVAFENPVGADELKTILRPTPDGSIGGTLKCDTFQSVCDRVTCEGRRWGVLARPKAGKVNSSMVRGKCTISKLVHHVLPKDLQDTGEESSFVELWITDEDYAIIAPAKVLTSLQEFKIALTHRGIVESAGLTNNTFIRMIYGCRENGVYEQRVMPRERTWTGKLERLLQRTAQTRAAFTESFSTKVPVQYVKKDRAVYIQYEMLFSTWLERIERRTLNEGIFEASLRRVQIGLSREPVITGTNPAFIKLELPEKVQWFDAEEEAF